MVTLKFPATQITQPGGIFYVVTVPSDVLNRISYVSVRSRNNPEGIQRYLSERRVKEVHDFVNKPEALLANNVIVNLSDEASFERSDPDSLNGVLYIPDRQGEAMIIDGQHRLSGFRGSATNFDITVAAFIDLELDMQAKLFRDINTEQKGIPTSLAYDLLDLTKDAEFVDLRAHEIVKRLNEESDSPWFNQIKMQGIGAGLITQSAFIEKLKPQVGSQGSIGDLDAEPQFLAVRNYWEAIKDLLPEAWGKAGYQLTKTLGFNALMDIFPRVAERALSKQDFRPAYLEKILAKLKDFDFSSTALKGLAGSAGRIELRSRLLDELDLQVKPKAGSIKFQ